MLNELGPHLSAFRNSHLGQKWATGKQRALAQKRGISLPEGLTCSEAQRFMDEALKNGNDHPSQLPPTEKQLEFLRKQKYAGTPANREEASQLIKTLLTKAQTATPKQHQLIMSLNPSIPEAALLAVTSRLTSQVVKRLLEKKKQGDGKDDGKGGEKGDGKGDGKD